MAEEPRIFYVNGFNYLATADVGTVSGATEMLPPTDYPECEMELYLSTAQHMFRFQTDAIDVNDVTTSDLKYNFRTPVGETGFNIATTHNPANAYMSQYPQLPHSGDDGLAGKLATDQVKYDWTRYLALKLFGSIHGTDIMSNEEQIRDSIVTNSILPLTASFAAIVAYQALTNSQRPVLNRDPDETILLDAIELLNDNAKYGPSKQILDKIFNNYPSRLAGVLLNTPLLQPVPLIVNDIIAFTMTVSPHSSQLTGLSMEGALGTVIPDYTYLVKMVIIADPI